MASPATKDHVDTEVFDMAEKMVGVLREQREKNPAAFKRALTQASKLVGKTPDEMLAVLDAPPPRPRPVTPAELVAQRPDLQAMQGMLPKAGPTSVSMQAEAQRTDQSDDGRPYVTYAGTRYYLRHDPDAFDLADLAEYMESADGAPILALGGINRLLRSWLADYDSLKKAWRRDHADKSLDDQMAAYGELAASLWEVTVARPTEAPAGSSDGRGPTTTSSKDASPSPAASPSTAPTGSTGSTPG